MSPKQTHMLLPLFTITSLLHLYQYWFYSATLTSIRFYFRTFCHKSQWQCSNENRDHTGNGVRYKKRKFVDTRIFLQNILAQRSNCKSDETSNDDILNSNSNPNTGGGIPHIPHGYILWKLVEYINKTFWFAGDRNAFIRSENKPRFHSLNIYYSAFVIQSVINAKWNSVLHLLNEIYLLIGVRGGGGLWTEEGALRWDEDFKVKHSFSRPSRVTTDNERKSL